MDIEELKKIEAPRLPSQRDDERTRPRKPLTMAPSSWKVFDARRKQLGLSRGAYVEHLLGLTPGSQSPAPAPSSEAAPPKRALRP